MGRGNGGAQVSCMGAIIEVGNSLGFNPNHLTFLLCDLEHVICVPNCHVVVISQNLIK